MEAVSKQETASFLFSKNQSGYFFEISNNL